MEALHVTTPVHRRRSASTGLFMESSGAKIRKGGWGERGLSRERHWSCTSKDLTWIPRAHVKVRHNIPYLFLPGKLETETSTRMSLAWDTQRWRDHVVNKEESKKPYPRLLSAFSMRTRYMCPHPHTQAHTYTYTMLKKCFSQTYLENNATYKSYFENGIW